MVTRAKYQKSLIIFTIILIIIGVMGLISASSIIGAEGYQDVYYFVKRQLLQGVLGGLIIAWIVSKINYRYWKKIAFFLLILNLILVGLCFFGPFKSPVNSAYRWLKFGPISFQPSEFLKITYVIFLVSILTNYSLEKRRKIFSPPFLIYIISLGTIAGILAKQPSTGTSIILCLSSLAIYFSAGLSWKQIIVVLLLGGLFLGFLITKTPYRLDRIKTFLFPFNDPLGKGYQSLQSLIGIGSGGLLGVGFGHSIQKFNYLPGSHTDAIFSIIAEEFGFVGSVFILLIFSLFIFAGLSIAKETVDPYGKFIIIGIISGIGFQAFINIAAMCKLIPITGIPLPFISYGSSAFIANLLGLGIISNIAKSSN
ncbi:MAG: FtsW/RodA/SpoVE family cell cycle protein [Candidatus Paceibacterota bacterium]|jgi:cell division protein FtsW